jgi:hypothetical protein
MQVSRNRPQQAALTFRAFRNIVSYWFFSISPDVNPTHLDVNVGRPDPHRHVLAVPDFCHRFHLLADSLADFFGSL